MALAQCRDDAPRTPRRAAAGGQNCEGRRQWMSQELLSERVRQYDAYALWPRNAVTASQWNSCNRGRIARAGVRVREHNPGGPLRSRRRCPLPPVATYTLRTQTRRAAGQLGRTHPAHPRALSIVKRMWSDVRDSNSTNYSSRCQRPCACLTDDLLATQVAYLAALACASSDS